MTSMKAKLSWPMIKVSTPQRLRKAMRSSVRPSSGSAWVRIGQRDAQLGQQQAAMLPIAQVQRDEKDAAPALAGGADDFQLTGVGQPVPHRHAALDAP